MYQTIHEPIAVVGVYNHATFVPKKFKWQDKIFAVEEITFTANSKDGGVSIRWYSVVVKGNTYRLLFNQQDEVWFMEEVWCE